MRRLLALAVLVTAATAHAQQYPQRPVQLIVPWGAGGGTDATARIIGTLLEKELKQPFNVVNRTGGSGVVGHDAIAKAAPDGYTIGMITVEITMMHHVGLTPLKHTDYTPIGLVNADPAGSSGCPRPLRRRGFPRVRWRHHQRRPPRSCERGFIHS